MFCGNCGKETDEHASSLCGSCGKPLDMDSRIPPEGYMLHTDSGLYYHAAKAGGCWTLTWYNLEDGSYTTEQYGSVAAGTPSSKRRNLRVMAVLAVLLVVLLAVGSMVKAVNRCIREFKILATAATSVNTAPAVSSKPSDDRNEPGDDSSEPTGKDETDAPLTEQQLAAKNREQERVVQGGLIATQGDWLFYADPGSGGLLCALNQADGSNPIVLTDYPVANINVLEDKLIFTDMVGSYLVRSEGWRSAIWILPSDLQSLHAYELLCAGNDRVVFGGELYEATGLKDFMRSGNANKLTITQQKKDEKDRYSYFVCADTDGITQLTQRFLRFPSAIAPLSQRQTAPAMQLGTVRTVSPGITQTNNRLPDVNIMQRTVTEEFLRSVDAVRTQPTSTQDYAVTHTYIYTHVAGEYKEYQVRESLDREQFAIQDVYTKETVIIKGHTVKSSMGTITYIDKETGLLMRFDRDTVTPLSTIPIKDYENNLDGYTLYYDDGDGKERAGLLTQRNLNNAYREAGLPIPGDDYQNGYRFYPAPPASVLGPEHGNLFKYSELDPRTDTLFRTDDPDGFQYTIMKDENGKNRWVKLQKTDDGWTIVKDVSDRMKIASYSDLLNAKERLQEVMNRVVGNWKENGIPGLSIENNPTLQHYLQKHFGWEGLVRGTDDEVKELKRDGGSEISLEITKEKFDMISGPWLSTAMRNGLPIHSLRLDKPDDSVIGFRTGEEMYGQTAYYICDARFDGVFLDLKVYEKDGGNDSLETGGQVDVGTMFYFRLEPDGRTLTYLGDPLDGLETGTQFK